MPDIPPHLHERYGIRPPSKWRFVWAALAVATLAFVGIYYVARFNATKNAEASIIEWSATSNTQVTLTFDVNAGRGERWCAVRAQAFDQFDVGFVVLPVSPPAQRVTYTMTTLEKPFAVDVVGCDEDPLQLFGPQFPPGVLPPAQTAPGRAPGLWQ